MPYKPTGKPPGRPRKTPLAVPIVKPAAAAKRVRSIRSAFAAGIALAKASGVNLDYQKLGRNDPRRIGRVKQRAV